MRVASQEEYSGNLYNPTRYGQQNGVRLQRLSDYRGCRITEVVRLQRLSDYRGCQIAEVVGLQRLSDYRGCQITEVVGLQRLSDYRVTCSIL